MTLKPASANDQVFSEQLRAMRARAGKGTQLLIDLVGRDLIPILVHGKFAPSPECAARTTNKFGLVWGINDLAFQDRTASCWPTIVLQFERSLEPYLKIELFEVPARPIMLDGTELARGEANAGHCVRLLLGRKGRSSSHTDQHFGAPTFALFKEHRIRRDVLSSKLLLERVIAVDRRCFLQSVESAVEPRFLYKSWDENDKLRPNRSS